jgi:hypothetical protein
MRGQDYSSRSESRAIPAGEGAGLFEKEGVGYPAGGGRIIPTGGSRIIPAGDSRLHHQEQVDYPSRRQPKPIKLKLFATKISFF